MSIIPWPATTSDSSPIEQASAFGFVLSQAVPGIIIIIVLWLLLRPTNPQDLMHFLIASSCITALAYVSTSMVVITSFEGGPWTLGANVQIAVFSGTTLLGLAIAYMYITHVKARRQPQ